MYLKKNSNLWNKVCIEGKQRTILFVIVALFSQNVNVHVCNIVNLFHENVVSESLNTL